MKTEDQATKQHHQNKHSRERDFATLRNSNKEPLRVVSSGIFVEEFLSKHATNWLEK